MEADPERIIDDLYRRYARSVDRAIHEIVQDREASRDLVQETFLRAWQHARGEESIVGAWLQRVGRNLAFDHVRNRQTSSRAESPDESGEGHLCREEVLSVHAALDRLDPAQRTLLELAFFEDLSQAEIGSRQRQPPSTIRSRLNVALQAMRLNLSAEGVLLPGRMPARSPAPEKLATRQALAGRRIMTAEQAGILLLPVIEHMRDAVVIADENGKFAFANTAAANLLAMTAPDGPHDDCAAASACICRIKVRRTLSFGYLCGGQSRAKQWRAR